MLRAAAGPGQGQQDSHLWHRLVRAGLNLLLVTQLEQKEDQLYRRVGGGAVRPRPGRCWIAEMEVLGVCHGEELRREVKMLCNSVLLELGGEQAEIFGRRLKECESRGVKEDCRRHPLYCHVMEESWTRWRPHPCSWPLLVGTMGPCWTRFSPHRQSGRQQGWGWGMARSRTVLARDPGRVLS